MCEEEEEEEKEKQEHIPNCFQQTLIKRRAVYDTEKLTPELGERMFQCNVTETSFAQQNTISRFSPHIWECFG